MKIAAATDGETTVCRHFAAQEKAMAPQKVRMVAMQTYRVSSQALFRRQVAQSYEQIALIGTILYSNKPIIIFEVDK